MTVSNRLAPSSLLRVCVCMCVYTHDIVLLGALACRKLAGQGGVRLVK